MEFGTNDVTNTMDTLPLIETEEELNNLLGTQQEDGKEGKQKPPTPPGNPAAPKETLIDGATNDQSEEGSDDPDDGDDDGDDDGGEGKQKKFTDYPSMLHYLNETNGLGINVTEEDSFTPEETAQAVSEIINRIVAGTNKSLQEYHHINELLSDDEVKELIVAKKEGKSLKDLYTKFAASPVAASDEVLAEQALKKNYPKSSGEAIKAMLDSLKTSGQFEPFVTGIREQYAEDEKARVAAEEVAKKEAEKKSAQEEKEQLETYQKYLGNLNAIHGIPLTDDMKQNIWKVTTEVDQNGDTELDRVLQSDEGTVLAAIGIRLLKNMIDASASLKGNRKSNAVISRIFDTPDKLQSGGGRGRNEDADDNLQLLNNF